jgi:dTDP-glucose 4,6-dehydratase
MSTKKSKRIIVTGGAGFIGSAFIRRVIATTDWQVLNIDKLTYAGNMETLASIAGNPNYQFILGDICDGFLVKKTFCDFKPDGLIHFAAESHVDRSINEPAPFISTNILGTYTLLESVRIYLDTAGSNIKNTFRFHHISTDEVFGSLGDSGVFSENSPYRPNSPYSASKAASDHLVRAWEKTYQLPVVSTNSSNNYGPFQHPEKLIPLLVFNALHERPLPIYGNGENVRDWLFIEDHVDALLAVFERGKIGETYNVGGDCEKTNIEVVAKICDLLDVKRPRISGRKYRELIKFVADRPGHDFRYAMNCTKIKGELGWRPQENFERGIEKTLDWYISNMEWCKKMRSLSSPLETNLE